MSSSSGRRRASKTGRSGQSAAARIGRRRAASPGVGLSLHRGLQFAGFGLAASGLLAMAVVPAAQPEQASAVGQVLAAPSAPSQYNLSQDITVAEDLTMSFARGGVNSVKPAAKPKGKTVAASAAIKARKAGAGSVSGRTATVKPVPAASSSRLGAPLMALNMVSGFGYRTNPLTGAAGELHTGLDFTGGCGTEVFSSGAGTVSEAGWHPYGGGNRIVVDHGNGVQTTYNHLNSIGVSVGQNVNPAQVIGAVGSTGNSTGCHLHFEVMLNGVKVDPSPLL